MIYSTGHEKTLRCHVGLPFKEAATKSHMTHVSTVATRVASSQVDAGVRRLAKLVANAAKRMKAAAVVELTQVSVLPLYQSDEVDCFWDGCFELEDGSFVSPNDS